MHKHGVHDAAGMGKTLERKPPEGAVMSTYQQPADALPGMTLAALLLAVFTVSAGFGVVLPLLPYLIERLLGVGAGSAQIGRHTGLLTADYTLALFLFAPVWGRLSDRYGPRRILLTGLLGFGITMLAFSLLDNLAAVYTERFLSGLFAAAVTPIAAAAIGEFPMSEEVRGRRLAFVSMAGIIGFLLGPMLGVFITRLVVNYFAISLPTGTVAIPLAAGALLAFVATCAVAWAMPGSNSQDCSHQDARSSLDDHSVWLLPKLLILSFIVSAGVGAFEVGLVLQGKQELNLTPYQIALMFTECSLVMFVMQAIIFSPWIRPDVTRWLITPALAVLAAGLFAIAWASDFMAMLIAIGAVAGSAGILSPILTYWISAKAGRAQGWQLGKQTAAASLGVTAGSAAGGVFYNAIIPGTSFVMAAVLVVIGILLGLGLPRVLVSNNQGQVVIDRSTRELNYLKERKRS